jgi:hypothetical protein
VTPAMRLARGLLVVAFVAWVIYALAFWAPTASSGPPGDPIPTVTTTTVALPAVLAPAKYAGHDAMFWHTAYIAQLRRTRALRRTLLHTPAVAEALNLACAVYGGCSTLWRRASCESRLRALATNAHSGAAGLLQFLPSTWATTPFARFDIYSPYANALAAGWMLTHGRGGEWSCR